MKHVFLLSIIFFSLTVQAFDFEDRRTFDESVTDCFEIKQCDYQSNFDRPQCLHPKTDRVKEKLEDRIYDFIHCSPVSDITYAFAVENKEDKVCLTTLAFVDLHCVYGW